MKSEMSQRRRNSLPLFFLKRVSTLICCQLYDVMRKHVDNLVHQRDVYHLHRFRSAIYICIDKWQPPFTIVEINSPKVTAITIVKVK